LPFLIIDALIPYESIMVNFGENGVKLTNTIVRLFRNLTRLLGLMAIIHIAGGEVIGIKYSFREALKIAYTRWWEIIKTGYMAGLIILGYTLLFIVPGIIRSVYYTFSMYIVVLRKISGKEALDYSKKLVEGQWWHVFGYTFLFLAMSYAIGIFLGLLLLLIPDILIIDLIVFTFAEICGVLFIIAITVFFINTDFLNDMNMENPIEHTDPSIIDGYSTP